MRLVRIKQPGPRTTVEDLGRAGVARFGVPPGGAFDALALRAANRLVGNGDDAAGLEMTLLGPVLENAGDEPVRACFVGSEVEAVVASGTDRATVSAARAFDLSPGATLRFPTPLRVARAWLALAGGIDVPLVLGGRGTYVPAAFGGLAGRALAKGDELSLGTPRANGATLGWRDPLGGVGKAETQISLLPGPQAHLFPPDVPRRLCESSWIVQATSDRTGVRLAPPEGDADRALEAPAGIPPEGTTLGAMQVPPDAAPILLGPDRPITGGYAKPAVVAGAHLGRLAALKPGDVVRFSTLSAEEAQRLLAARESSLPEVVHG